MKDWIGQMRDEQTQIKHFIENNTGREVTQENIDDIIYPSWDGTSAIAIDMLSEDQAIEDTLDVLKESFRKKKIPLDQFLNRTRELCDEKFLLIVK